MGNVMLALLLLCAGQVIRTLQYLVLLVLRRLEHLLEKQDSIDKRCLDIYPACMLRRPLT